MMEKKSNTTTNISERERNRNETVRMKQTTPRVQVDIL